MRKLPQEFQNTVPPEFEARRTQWVQRISDAKTPQDWFAILRVFDADFALHIPDHRLWFMALIQHGVHDVKRFEDNANIVPHHRDSVALHNMMTMLEATQVFANAREEFLYHYNPNAEQLSAFDYDMNVMLKDLIPLILIHDVGEMVAEPATAKTKLAETAVNTDEYEEILAQHIIGEYVALARDASSTLDRILSPSLRSESLLREKFLSPDHGLDMTGILKAVKEMGSRAIIQINEVHENDFWVKSYQRVESGKSDFLGRLAKILEATNGTVQVFRFAGEDGGLSYHNAPNHFEYGIASSYGPKHVPDLFAAHDSSSVVQGLLAAHALEWSYIWAIANLEQAPDLLNVGEMLKADKRVRNVDPLTIPMTFASPTGDVMMKKEHLLWRFRDALNRRVIPEEGASLITTRKIQGPFVPKSQIPGDVVTFPQARSSKNGGRAAA